MTKHQFILVHSPLLRAFTWKSVAKTLRQLGFFVSTPILIDHRDNTLPIWRQEVDSIQSSADSPIIVGHSGAGALLPSIGKKLNAKALIFVDAVLIFESMSRLDLLRQEDAEIAQKLETHLQAGGKFPEWTHEDLYSLIPDDSIRENLLADVQPRGLDFFTEKIEPPMNWQNQPCGYIQLSETYAGYMVEALAHHWYVKQYITHHFEMMTNPTQIAQLIIEATEQLIIS